MGKKKDFLNNSQFGSLPPKVIIAFILFIIIFLMGFTVLFMIVEEWGFGKALYFAIVTISTVGYGDVVPLTVFGKVLTITYTFSSFCGIFLLFRVVVGYVVDHQIHMIIERVKVKKKEASASRGGFFSALSTRAKSLDKLASDAKDELDDEKGDDIQHGRNIRWIYQLIVYLIWLFMWTMFYCWFKKEDMKFFNALYFGATTSTTVGYGDFSPMSDDGKVFCVILLMFGTLALGLFAGSVSNGMVACLRAIFKKKDKNGAGGKDVYLKTLESLLEAPKSGDGKIDKLDFVCKMLVGEGKCAKKQIKKLLDEFDKLDINNDGVLDIHDFNISTQQTLLGNESNDGDKSNKIEMVNIVAVDSANEDDHSTGLQSY